MERRMGNNKKKKIILNIKDISGHMTKWVYDKLRSNEQTFILQLQYLTRFTYGHAGFGRLVTGHLADNY